MARPGEPRAAFPSTLPHPPRLSDGAARFVPAPGRIAGRTIRRPRFSPCGGGFVFCHLLVQDYAPCRSKPRPSRKSLEGDG